MIKQVLFLLVILTTSISNANFKGFDRAETEADRNATLNRIIPDYPKTLNPTIYASASEFEIVGTMFDSLIGSDPDTGEPDCMLCTKFVHAKDKKSVTFYLRKGVRFHDGKPLTAEDVEFSFRALMHPKVDNLNLKSGTLAAIKKVEILDKHTVRIHFYEPKYANIFQTAISVIPKHLFPYFDKDPEKFNKDQKFSRSPTGSGPYKFRKWAAGKFVEVVRNDDWFGFKDPKFKNTMNFKKVRFKVITDDNVRLQAFLKGEFDYMNLQSYQYDEIRKNPGKQKYVLPVHLEPKVNTSFMFISWNSRLPIFADVKTRHALSLLADRFSVLDKFSRGLRPPTNGPWGKMSPFSCPESECPVIPFDVKKGKKLLKEAGWKDSDGDGVLDRTIDGKKQKLAFTILAGQGDYSRNLLGVYATEYKKAGIDAKVKQLDWTAMNKLVDDLKFQAFLSGFQAGYPMIPRQLWHSENAGKTGSNSWGFKNKKADKLIVQFEKEFNPKKRIQIARKIHKIIYNNHPCMFHHEGGGCYAGKNKSLEGFEVANYSTNCLYWPRWYKKAGAKSAAAADSVEAAGSTSCCSTWLIIALIAGLGIVGFVIRKKKKA